MLEEYDLRNSKVVSNSHLRNRGTKKKSKNLKLSDEKIHFFRHEAFDTVFLNPSQEQFVVTYLNYFETFLKDFMIESNKKSRKNSRKSRKNSKKQEINGDAKEPNKQIPDYLKIEKFIETHKKILYKRLLIEIKKELTPFDKFYSRRRKNQSIPYGSIPKRNELYQNLGYEVPERLIGTNKENEWESIKRKEVVMVECQNESIFDNSKKVMPVSIKGKVSKRQKVTYKGVDKKNYPKFGFLAHESEFLLISLNMNDLLMRTIFFFWEFIIDFKNLEMDEKFLKNICKKMKSLREIFTSLVKQLAQGKSHRIKIK